MNTLSPYLQQMIQHQGSDLFFTPGAAVHLKVEGAMLPLPGEALTADTVRTMLQEVLSEEEWQKFLQQREWDGAFTLPDGNRFRGNAFFRQGEPALVLRWIRASIPNLDSLGVPAILGELVLQKRGLILVVGGTGSGKSTTLAAMLQHRNQNLSGHILTIEDPVEFIHPHQRSLVNQREVGRDTHSFERALHSALRAAPDLLLIGEIRDRTTMEAALQLAGTGHLALSTLHANNACQALNRIINLFPQAAHHQLLLDLSLYLRGIVSQRLLPGLDGRRRVAVEVLLNTPYVAELMARGDVDGVRTALTEGGEPGMQSFDTALYQLYRSGAIALTEALQNADSRANLEARIHFSG
ncbi:MAG: PilT/PilU family type 4a pilus ATPase [Magnetococcales bacterium]|nr:PilT/PilU family type 4a pilus ATPase [Magnetococcales bacterium]MBF0116053.1 PilT/PilU family type 4a pilus ATPase [Magnetococcales bacterium]